MNHTHRMRTLPQWTPVLTPLEPQLARGTLTRSPTTPCSLLMLHKLPALRMAAVGPALVLLWAAEPRGLQLHHDSGLVGDGDTTSATIVPVPASSISLLTPPNFDVVAVPSASNPLRLKHDAVTLRMWAWRHTVRVMRSMSWGSGHRQARAAWFAKTRCSRCGSSSACVRSCPAPCQGGLVHAS